jgi:hypothetical protein
MDCGVASLLAMTAPVMPWLATAPLAEIAGCFAMILGAPRGA